uniref:Uncharacterized protein n=1 Tax=Alexandrium andersonii TaxID=327968 RepID=A0A7S2DWB7_9DINO
MDIDVSEAAGPHPGVCTAPRPGDRFREPTEEACPEFTSLAIQLGPAPRRGGSRELGAAGAEYLAEREGDSPRGSDAGSSESFDLEVDELWSRRVEAMEEKERGSRRRYFATEDGDEDDDDDDDDDNPVLYSRLFFQEFLQSQLMARVAMGEGLRALNDQTWCQILYSIEEGEGEEEDHVDGVEGEEKEQPRKVDRELVDSSGDSSRDSSMERRWSSMQRCGRGRKCPASFRMRGPIGPKDDGPLSKLIDLEVLDSE